MYKILTLNSIAACGLEKLPPAEFCVSAEEQNPDAVILRSFDMNNMPLPASLKAVSRAGAGINNIPVDKCSELGIVVFNTPGANANAVKELVLCGLLLGSRRVAEGIAWAKTLDGEDVAKQVEKGKGQFVGPELRGKKLGVIGLGAIGALVANAAVKLGMEVMGHDPFLSVDAAWSLSSSVTKAASMDSLIAECDYITLHIPCTDKTRGMFNKEKFDLLKPDARLLNFARAELVDADALANALESGKLACYITDFPTQKVLGLPNTVCLPHLGASTPESEENCAQMAAAELKNYLCDGIIRNSVNFPNCEMPYSGHTRIGILHRNIPNMVGSAIAVLAGEGLNINNMSNQSKGNWAYTLIDIDGGLNGRGAQLCEQITAIEGICAARVVREQQ